MVHHDQKPILTSMIFSTPGHSTIFGNIRGPGRLSRMIIESFYREVCTRIVELKIHPAIKIPSNQNSRIEWARLVVTPIVESYMGREIQEQGRLYDYLSDAKNATWNTTALGHVGRPLENSIDQIV
jgi:hypothetical protein